MVDKKEIKENFNELISTQNLFFPSAEIYPNYSGFFEYGPIGHKIKLNIIDFWRKEFVKKNNFKEISGSIILPKKVFEASGHLKNFDDPIAICSKTKKAYRLDKLLSKRLEKDIPENLTIQEFKDLINKNNIKSDDDGELIDIKRFNLMANITVGAQSDNIAYLRGETCQSIFLDFLRIYKNSREDLPLGISQYGTVYRNEISPRNGLLRTREIEQLETELFFNPEKINDYNLDSINDYKIRFRLIKDNLEKDYSVKEVIENKISYANIITYYLHKNQEFLKNIGIKHENIRFREVEDNERAFYSKQTFDCEVYCEGEWVELFCVNYRTDYDLNAHQKGSKQKLSVKEEGKEFVPHVLEVSSIGLGRLFYCLLENSFDVEENNEKKRNVLRLKPKISPYFVSVLPLVKKDGLLELSKEIYDNIVNNNFELFDVFFDEKGSIGKRYARLDQLGCNYSLTIDHQSKEDNTITIRDRDSLEQKRISIENIENKLIDLYNQKIYFKDL